MTNLRMAINNDTKKIISICKGSMVVFKHAHDIQDVNKIHWTKLIFAKKDLFELMYGPEIEFSVTIRYIVY